MKPGMKAVNLRRGLNRIFLLLVAGWALFCLFVAPVQMGTQARTHYERDLRSCHEIYGPAGTLPGRDALEDCLSQSEREFKAGTYSGFGFVWDDGEFWSLKGYYRHMGWGLALMIIIPPILVYGLAWLIAAVCFWIWRGFRPASSA